eukprot:752615-Hanusia_phi.AAC.3
MARRIERYVPRGEVESIDSDVVHGRESRGGARDADEEEGAASGGQGGRNVDVRRSCVAALACEEDAEERDNNAALRGSERRKDPSDLRDEGASAPPVARRAVARILEAGAVLPASPRACSRLDVRWAAPAAGEEEIGGGGRGFVDPSVVAHTHSDVSNGFLQEE